MASRIAEAAIRETPNALSFAPTRASKAEPVSRSIDSGPTNGMAEGKLLTSGVNGNGITLSKACPDTISTVVP